jgi:ectoine hydroxylase-related dioxygenase (phytanoyl-CoA dioxygenase family)
MSEMRGRRQFQAHSSHSRGCVSFESILSQHVRDGVSRLGQVFDQGQIAVIQSRLKDLIGLGSNIDAGYDPTFEPTADGKTLRKLRRLFWNDPDFWSAQILSSRIIDIAQIILGAPVSMIFHAAFLKPASVGTPVALHQDQFLWDRDFPNAVNIWVAITPSQIENGCLIGCPGSHKQGPLPHNAIPEHPWHPGVDWKSSGLVQPVPYTLHAGDGLAWDRWFVHGSGPNQSAAPRWGVVMAFADRAQLRSGVQDRVDFN